MKSALMAAWFSGIALLGPAAPLGGAAPASLPDDALTAPAFCTCAAAKVTNGWCEAHGIGYVALVPIRSRMLYETLDAHGHTLDLGTFQCPSCKKAIESDGFCVEHRVGFVKKQAYFSRLTYELARGESRDPATITCPVCRKNAESHGWCSKCKLGMVGTTAIRDKKAYEAVANAIEILTAATKAIERCEDCAVAMVTDTQCPRCRITYKNGKPLPPNSGPSGSKPK